MITARQLPILCRCQCHLWGRAVFDRPALRLRPAWSSAAFAAVVVDSGTARCRNTTHHSDAADFGCVARWSFWSCLDENAASEWDTTTVTLPDAGLSVFNREEYFPLATEYSGISGLLGRLLLLFESPLLAASDMNARLRQLSRKSKNCEIFQTAVVTRTLWCNWLFFFFFSHCSSPLIEYSNQTET